MFENYEYGTMAKEIDDLFGAVEKFMNAAARASGMEFMDMIKGMDERTGAMAGAAIELYNKSKGSAINAGRRFDEMSKQLCRIQELNESLVKRNEQLESMLRSIEEKRNRMD